MRTAVRALLAWFAILGLVVGGWQAFAPASLYRDFPGLGRHWVSPDGPYNEHLLRDVGQGNLALGALALVALLAGGVWLARATGIAELVAALPHQLYHQAHLDVLPVSERVPQTVALTAVTLTAVALAGLAFRIRAPSATAAASGDRRRAHVRAGGRAGRGRR
jgi:hypothetical protein